MMNIYMDAIQISDGRFSLFSGGVPHNTESIGI